MFEHLIIHAIIEAASHKARRSGAALKLLRCEECETEYVYLINRTAFVKTLASRQQAERRAEELLEEKLAAGCELVPCPVCGRFQKDMVRRERRRLRGKIHPLTVVLGFLWMPFVFMTAVSATIPKENLTTAVLGSIAALCFLAFIACVAFQLLRPNMWDPNATDQDRRIELGQKLAKRWDEVAHLVEDEDVPLFVDYSYLDGRTS